MTLDARLAEIRTRIADAAARSGRDAAAVTLVGVTKTVGREEVDEAYALGVRHFGENRVPDAVRKFATPLPDDAVLHMIGQLQSNKAGQAAKLFDVIQSVDRPSLVEALVKQGAALGRPITVLLEVGIAGEEQKAGCDPEEAPALAAAIVASPHLALRGLMTMAPLVDDAEGTRPVFRGLRELRDRLQEAHPDARLDWLSMGMTNDFAVAIEEGATHVRVGRALFGG
jgi:pyridoxal phosphate enzyme (YggS family)